MAGWPRGDEGAGGGGESATLGAWLPSRQRQRYAGGGEQAADLHGAGGLQGSVPQAPAADVPQSERELARAEYQRLLDAAQARGDIRLLLLLETLCATGIRVSELQYITVEAARNGVAEIALKGKIRTILLPTKLCRKLLKYAKKCGIVHGQIFLTKKGNGLSRKLIWAEMKKLCEAAKVARSKVLPHNLRGLFARTFYAACQDVVRLADVLGHSSIETTRIYLLSTAKESARQLDRLGLLSRWHNYSFVT